MRPHVRYGEVLQDGVVNAERISLSDVGMMRRRTALVAFLAIGGGAHADLAGTDTASRGGVTNRAVSSL